MFLGAGSILAGAYVAGIIPFNTKGAVSQVQQMAEKHITAPPPLRGPTEPSGAVLTAAGILRETNKHRAAAGLSPLTANAALAVAAQAKTDDMFTRQYFEHESPDGDGPGDVVEAAGYDFLRVGENLALGNFNSDADLVQAWMDSPGHRANILNPGFTEIGISAAAGQFISNHTWLAVQEFGLPASACPAPDPNVRTAFEQAKSESSTAARREELTARSTEIQQRYDEANRLAKDANEKINRGNSETNRGNEIYQETGDESQARPHWEKGKELQTEGRALYEQAQQLQSSADRQRDELQRQRDQFNAQIFASNAELQRQANEINQQIRTYNECINKFQ